VALTRACDLLLLSGSMAAKRIEQRWNASSGARPSLRRLLSARCYLDWLGGMLRGMTGSNNWIESGVGPGLVWRVHRARGTIPDAGDVPEIQPDASSPNASPAPEVLHDLERRIAWQYPFQAATQEPAKTTVSALRRRRAEERDDDAVVWRPRKLKPDLSGAEVGEAHHLFLEGLALTGATDVTALRAEARRLADEGLITPTQADALDLDAITAFWQSSVGTDIRAQSKALHRELPFTARFALEELAELDLIHLNDGIVGDQRSAEWVIVQGVVDLAVIRNDEIWVLDFKTDQSRDLDGLIESYTPQLRLYALALERIYCRPVSRLWIHSFAARQTISLA
jgi:ATP-dependent helicase/nuclease subunit A